MSAVRKMLVVCLAIGTVLLVGVAAQQTNTTTQEGLVNVDVSNIKADIAKDINVDVSQIPVTVQVPVDVAANVCGVDVSVLTSQLQQGNATCTARSTSTALNDTVQNQIKQQK